MKGNPYRPAGVDVYERSLGKWELQIFAGPHVFVIAVLPTEAEAHHQLRMLTDAFAAAFDPLDPDDC